MSKQGNAATAGLSMGSALAMILFRRADACPFLTLTHGLRRGAVFFRRFAAGKTAGKIP
jgi:hypothetical protein